MITKVRHADSKCINLKCKRYHRMILAGEPRGISGHDRLGRERHLCMDCVIKSRVKHGKANKNN